MSNNLTTRDLVGALIDLELERDLYSNDEESLKKVNEAIISVKSQIKRKTSGIDHMIVEMNKKADIIDAEIKTYNDEIKRLKNRKKAIQKTETYFNKELLPMIIETAGENGVFQTTTTRYKMYETWGPVEIIDEDAISDSYKRFKVEIDKKKARKDAIDAAETGTGIAGFKIEKTKTIRRS
jgi:hypothetical protein